VVTADEPEWEAELEIVRVGFSGADVEAAPTSVVACLPFTYWCDAAVVAHRHSSGEKTGA
jgi:hypothetical protein